MRHFILAIITLLFTGSALANCPQFAYGGELPTSAEPQVILCKRAFAVGYSTSRRAPLWVAELVDPEKITLPNAVDSLPFRQDPALPLAQQAPLSDFVGSGLDRGHLAPFENVNHDAAAAAESMYATNIVPQHPGNNRGIWRVLEDKVRAQALDGKLFVVTIPVYAERRTIGSGTLVPTHLIKVIIDPKRKRSVSYIIPNASALTSDLPKFVSTRARVRELSGIDPVPVISLAE